MKSLPNNCRRGKLVVSPANWKTGGNKLLREKWYIKYIFYDDNSRESKQVMISRFNTFDNIEDRRGAMKTALIRLDYDLAELGYNPIAKNTQKPVEDLDASEINKFTPFMQALQHAKGMKRVSADTMKRETGWVLSQIETAAKALHLDKMPIWNITLKHLFLICEKAAYKVDKTYSGDKFNRNKKVLRELYKKMLILEIVQANYPLSLEHQKGALKKKKVLLTKDERKGILEYLRAPLPKHTLEDRTLFLNFIQMFYHSGARLTEMMRLQVKDVDLSGQSITYLVMKGREYSYKERPIKDIALPYWIAAVDGAAGSDYVFSTDLKHGATLTSPEVIKQRWKRLKKQLNLKTGIYSLKHLNTTETTARLGVAAAAIQNAESEQMIKRHYDVDNLRREHDAIKKVDNPL